MYGTDPTLAPSKADTAQANAECAREALELLLKRFAFETAERFHDEIEKIGIEADYSTQKLSVFLADTLTDSVFWPDPETARFDAQYGERR